MTPYAHYTNEELIRLAYRSAGATPLEIEFAFRMESNYADNTAAMADDPRARQLEGFSFAADTRG